MPYAFRKVHPVNLIQLQSFGSDRLPTRSAKASAASALALSFALACLALPRPESTVTNARLESKLGKSVETVSRPTVQLMPLGPQKGVVTRPPDAPYKKSFRWLGDIKNMSGYRPQSSEFGTSIILNTERIESQVSTRADWGLIGFALFSVMAVGFGGLGVYCYQKDGRYQPAIDWLQKTPTVICPAAPLLMWQQQVRGGVVGVLSVEDKFWAIGSKVDFIDGNRLIHPAAFDAFEDAQGVALAMAGDLDE